MRLELVQDMSTQQFMLAFRRFNVRRGLPTIVISDTSNAKQFRLAPTAIEKLFAQIVHSEDLQSYVAGKEIQWKFITEYAPWIRGMHERLVGTVKKSLRKALGSNLCTVSQMTTILAEVKAVVNSRPLRYVSADINDFSLTPAHFLIGHSLTALPDTAFQDDYQPANRSSAEQLIQSWKKGQNILNSFWKHWYTEYIVNLRESHKLTSGSSSIPAVGDIVFVKESSANVFCDHAFRLSAICQIGSASV